MWWSFKRKHAKPRDFDQEIAALALAAHLQIDEDSRLGKSKNLTFFLEVVPCGDCGDPLRIALAELAKKL
jgi:hypothetical protein